MADSKYLTFKDGKFFKGGGGNVLTTEAQLQEAINAGFKPQGLEATTLIQRLLKLGRLKMPTAASTPASSPSQSPDAVTSSGFSLFNKPSTSAGIGPVASGAAYETARANAPAPTADDLGVDPFDFGDLGGSGAVGPSAEELALLAVQAELAPLIFEETKRSNLATEAQNAADLEARKRQALAASIASLFDTNVSDAGNRRSGAVSTLQTALPRAITDQGAALLGRQIPGLNNGQPIETTDVPLDTAALDPTDTAALLEDADRRSRGVLGYADGGVISKLYGADTGAITTGTDSAAGAIQTANIDPILAAQQQAMADLRDYANQFGNVPQQVVDATLAYYNVPPGTITLPPSLTKQTLDQSAIEFRDREGRLHSEFESQLAHDAAVQAAHDNAQARISAGQNANALEIARGHDTTALQQTRISTGSNETIARNALAENKRQFDASLTEEQRQNLAALAANPRRVIEAAYYQAGSNPTAAASQLQNQITQPLPPFTGVGSPGTGGVSTQPVGAPVVETQTPPPTVGAPASTAPTPSTGAGTAFGQANSATTDDRAAAAAQRAANEAKRVADFNAKQAKQKAAALTSQNQGAAPAVANPNAAGNVAAQAAALAALAASKKAAGMAEGGMVSDPSSLAGIMEGALLRRAAKGAVVKPFGPVASSAAQSPKTAIGDAASQAPRPPVASSVSRGPSRIYGPGNGPRSYSRLRKLREEKVSIPKPVGAPPKAYAKGGSIEGPAVILVGEGKDGSGIKNGTHEYVLAPPGTVIAPAEPGDVEPSMDSAIAALRKQIGKARLGRAAKGKVVSARKAKEIMKDGSVRGKALSKKQRGLFGAIAGGAKMKMRKAASGYVDPLLRAADGLINTTITPALRQFRRGSAYNPLGGANLDLLAELPDINSLPTYGQLNKLSGTQRGLFEGAISAGGVEPQDVIDFINRGFEGFGSQVGAGQTARVGRGF